MSTVQRLSANGRALAYEPVASDGLNPLREAMRAYVSGNRDHAVALIRRGHEARELDTFGLMHLVPSRSSGPDEPRCAALIYMAPSPHTGELIDAWAELAEAFVVYGTARGAQCVVAETPEDGHEAEALHRVGFSSLIHQDIMKLGAMPDDMDVPDVLGLRPQTDKDDAYVKLLSMRVVPKLIQKAEASTDLSRLTHRTDCGFLLMRNQDPIGHVSVQTGRRGYGLQLMFRPEAEELAEPVLQYILANLCDKSRRPIYCMIPSYQSWLLPVLDNIGFVHVTSNTILVKHTTARVRQPVWSIQPKVAHTKLIKSDTKLQVHKSSIEPEGHS